MKEIKEKIPSANIAINKSRIKVYNKKSDMPTYYLNKGQEFQIELFNPTNKIILAKISLNNKLISQGGLVLKPGQRVFLDRYIDVAKKFKFDTYEVANNNEVKEAIKDNGDFKVEFFNESEPLNINFIPRRIYRPYDTNGSWGNSGGYNNSLNTTTCNYSNNISSEVTLDSMEFSTTSLGSTKLRSKKSKSIDTGRVEMGDTSNQKFETVNYEFNISPFHTIIYKILPSSQKVNTVNDITKYCTECGSKQKKNNKFCPNCGTRV